jgi:hypothetical protein
MYIKYTSIINVVLISMQYFSVFMYQLCYRLIVIESYSRLKQFEHLHGLSR